MLLVSLLKGALFRCLDMYPTTTQKSEKTTQCFLQRNCPSGRTKGLNVGSGERARGASLIREAEGKPPPPEGPAALPALASQS